MKTEISAGGIVARKKGKGWNVLVMRDMNGNWTFPKGIIEKGESPEKAARREVFEEVGIKSLKIIKKLNTVRYMYKRGDLISKTVHYFLFLLLINETLKPQKEEGVSEVKWVSLSEAVNIIGYPKTNKPILENVYGSLSGT